MEEDSSSSSSSDSEDEDEPGLFLSLRSSSTTSLHRLDRLGALSSSSTATSPKSYNAIIAPLPATTLRAAYDVGEEEELRRAEAANSVAYAMSHNTQPRTHIYTVYDYNSVYKSPSQSPQAVQSPDHLQANLHMLLLRQLIQRRLWDHLTYLPIKILWKFPTVQKPAI